MPSQNIARLGVILGLDIAEFTKEVDSAVAANKKLSREIRKESNDAKNFINQLTTEMEDYGKTISYTEKLQREFAKGGRFAELEKTPEIKRQLIETVRKYDDHLKKVNEQQKEFNKNGKLTQQQLMGINYQLTDIVTGLAGGQNPLLIMVQQGGQLKDMFGGIGPMFRALASVFTPLRLAVGGFAAAVGTLGYAFYKGREDLKEFNNQLVLTNNYAGITIDRYKAAASSIANATGISVANAKDIYNAMISSGDIAEKSMQSLATTIALVSRRTGETGEEVSKRLVPALTSGANAIFELDKRANFLTFAQYKQIAALELTKDRAGQAEIASKAYAEQLSKDIPSLSYYAKIIKSISDAWESLKNIGAPPTLDEQIGKLEKQLEIQERLLSAGAAAFEINQDAKTKQRILNIKQEIEVLKGLKKSREDASEKVREEAQKKEQYAAAGGLPREIALRYELEKEQSALLFQQQVFQTNALDRIDMEAAQKKRDAQLKFNQDNAMAAGFQSQRAAILAVQIKKIDEEAKQKKEELILQEKKEFNEKIVQLQYSYLLELEKQKLYKENINATDEDVQKIAARLAMEREIALIQENRLIDAAEKERRIQQVGLLVEQQGLIAAENKRFEMQRNNQRVVEEQLQNTENGLALERKKLEIYEKNIFISEADYNIALQRLEIEQEIAKIQLKVQEGKLSKEQGDADIERLRRIQTERESIGQLADRLTMLRDINKTVFQSMENAIMNFVRTGKLSFKDLAKSIIADIMAIYIKSQMLSMFRMFTGGFGRGNVSGAPGVGGGDLIPSAVTTIGFAAEGGQIDGPTIVGELGPELFIPKSAGTIIPNNKMDSFMGGPQIVYNGPYIASMNAIDTQSATQFLARNKMAVYAANQSATRGLPVSR